MMQPFDTALLRHTPAKYHLPAAQERAALKRERCLWRARGAQLLRRAAAVFGARWRLATGG